MKWGISTWNVIFRLWKLSCGALLITSVHTYQNVTFTHCIVVLVHIVYGIHEILLIVPGQILHYLDFIRNFNLFKCSGLYKKM